MASNEDVKAHASTRDNSTDDTVGRDEIMAERYDDVLRPVAWLPMAAFQQADVAGADHG